MVFVAAENRDIASRCLEIHQAVPELGGIFDPANFVQCGQDTLEAWKMLAPYVHYLHIKDALLSDGAVVCAGHGDGNVPEILRRLKEQGITRFRLLFRGNRSRSEVVATFLSILELCKTGSVSLEGDISGENPDVRLIKSDKEEGGNVNGTN